MPVLNTGILVILSGATYIIGAHFYIYNIPERLNPGFFDIWVYFILISLIVTLYGTYSYLVLHFYISSQ